MDTHPAQMPVLSVSDLTTAFRSGDQWKPVVRNLSFSIAPRETVAIVGESGSGKSVTSLSIMRLLPKYASRIEGKVVFGGRDLLALGEEEMRKVRGNDISMIFQEPMTSLNPIFPIGKQIAEAITCHRSLSRSEARAEVTRLLEKVRIPNAKGRFDDYPHQFSGGMRQRVMIAMALASKPKLLIADEPTTALDVTIQGQILDLIKTLQEEEDMAVLFITHDMGVVAEVADRTIVMFRGDAVETGATEDIFNSGRHPYTRALLSAVPRLGSMAGRARPMRFPVIDITTGETRQSESEGPMPATGERPLLEVKNLTTRFDIRSGLLGRRSGAVHAVEDVSFDLKAGETLSLVGESGCGKSTTGRSIIRLVEPTGGAISLGGHDVMGLDRGALRTMRRSIQMVFQDPFASLDPRMTVGAAVMEPFIEHGLGTRRAGTRQGRRSARACRAQRGHDAALSRTNSPAASASASAIARALMLDPKVIIADEAVSALDVSVKAQVVQPASRPAAELRPRLSVHQPRSGCRGTGQSSGGGDVSRRDRRDRPAPGRVRKSAASLYEEADGRRADPRSRQAHHPAKSLHRRDKKPGPPSRLCPTQAVLP